MRSGTLVRRGTELLEDFLRRRNNPIGGFGLPKSGVFFGKKKKKKKEK
jgi:hypothetical protein